MIILQLIIIFVSLYNNIFALILRLRLEGTFARKNKKIAFFLGFLLTYSYLCRGFGNNGK